MAMPVTPPAAVSQRHSGPQRSITVYTAIAGPSGSGANPKPIWS